MPLFIIQTVLEDPPPTHPLKLRFTLMTLRVISCPLKLRFTLMTLRVIKVNLNLRGCVCWGGGGGGVGLSHFKFDFSGISDAP